MGCGEVRSGEIWSLYSREISPLHSEYRVPVEMTKKSLVTDFGRNDKKKELEGLPPDTCPSKLESVVGGERSRKGARGSGRERPYTAALTSFFLLGRTQTTLPFFVEIFLAQYSYSSSLRPIFLKPSNFSRNLW